MYGIRGNCLTGLVMLSLNVIRKTKISCYTTPGIDESKEESNDYNQVTPRLFELLCNGCQVIGHYPLTDDVLWYDLPSIVPNVNNYEDFEMILDEMRCKSIDVKSVMDFMSRHYTTKRVSELPDILKKYNFSI